MEETRWGILNVYAPNHASARARLWEEIYLAIPEDEIKWIVGGDFNMLEDPQDRRGGSRLTIQGQELANWERLVFKLRISDAWHLSNIQRGAGSLQFSRSDRKGGRPRDNTSGSQPWGESVVREEVDHERLNESRIDRIYLSDYFAILEGEITIMPGTTLSDHAPVLLTLQQGGYRKRGRSQQVRIPDWVFQEDKYKSEVESLWHKATELGGALEKLDNALVAASDFFKGQTKQLAELRGQQERNLRRALRALHRLQECHPSCSWTTERME